MSVLDNVKLAAAFAGRNITDSDASAYLEYVNIKMAYQKYPNQLTACEKHRVGLACALAKNSDLIIVDNPQLSPEQVADLSNIYKRIASESKKVVIITNDEMLCNESDVIYEIHDDEIYEKINKINSEQSNLTTPGSPEQKPLSRSFFMWYARRIPKRTRLINRLIVALGAIAIAFGTIVSNFGNDYIAKQEKTIKSIHDNELLTINMTAVSDKLWDMDENIAISDGEYQKMSRINNLSSIYQYYEFQSNGFDLDAMRLKTEADVQVNIDGKEQNQHFDYGKVGNYKSYTIAPYYEEQQLNNNLKKQLEYSQTDSNEIYLSSTMAHTLGIDNTAKHVELTLNIYVPVGLIESDMHKKENPGETILTDINFSKVKQIHIEVAGILDDSIVNSYSNSGENMIYFPYEMMEQIRNEQYTEYKNNGVWEPLLMSWNPSAYMIYINDSNFAHRY